MEIDTLYHEVRKQIVVHSYGVRAHLLFRVISTFNTPHIPIKTIKTSIRDALRFGPFKLRRTIPLP